jgi:hypothetical protein
MTGPGGQSAVPARALAPIGDAAIEGSSRVRKGTMPIEEAFRHSLASIFEAGF